MSKATQYIAFIYNNAQKPTTQKQWDTFFIAANKSGLFTGGSEIEKGVQIGAKTQQLISDTIVGQLRFEVRDIKQLHELLALHPVLIEGGTLELCEMPKT